MGDLRTGETDPIDWVESIPFQETRQYVQKVLQNLHVYRSRLAPKTVRPMSADLARGSTGDALNVASTSAPVEQTEAAAEAKPCTKDSITDFRSVKCQSANRISHRIANEFANISGHVHNPVKRAARMIPIGPRLGRKT